MKAMHVIELALKTLIRSNVARSAIAAFIILSAILSAATAITNYISAETTELSNKIIGSNVLNIACGDPEECSKIKEELKKTEGIKALLEATLQIAKLKIGNKEISVTAIHTNITKYSDVAIRRLNGNLPGEPNEALIGETLARILNLSIGTKLILEIGNELRTVEIAGIYKASLTDDVAIVLPLDSGKGQFNIFSTYLIRVYFINYDYLNKALNELRSFKAMFSNEGLNAGEFIEETNNDVKNLVNFWYLIALAVVIASSYIIALKLSLEFRETTLKLYELGSDTLRNFVFLAALVILASFLGSVIGTSLGLVGTQIVSTVLSWFVAGAQANPFLNVVDYLRIVLSVTAASIVGGIPPSVFYAMRVGRGVTH
jgi:hypothetical protein